MANNASGLMVTIEDRLRADVSWWHGNRGWMVQRKLILKHLPSLRLDIGKLLPKSFGVFAHALFAEDPAGSSRARCRGAVRRHERPVGNPTYRRCARVDVRRRGRSAGSQSAASTGDQRVEDHGFVERSRSCVHHRSSKAPYWISHNHRADDHDGRFMRHLNDGTVFAWHRTAAWTVILAKKEA